MLPSASSIISTYSRPAVLLLLLFALIGTHLGAEYHVRFGKAFVRTAIRIEPRIPLFIATPWYASLTTDLASSIKHDKFLADDNAILKCIERYPELKPETSFPKLLDGQFAAEISQNIAVKIDRDDPSIFELRYRTNNPVDGSLILKQLVESYRESLDAQKEDLAEKEMTLLAAGRELDSHELAALRGHCLTRNSFRFQSISSCKRDTDFEDEQMFWSMFVGAAIAFSMTAVAVVFTRFRSPNHRSPQQPSSKPHAKAPSSQNAA